MPAKKGVESSCTAAITEQNEWLRLFPVRYRYLPSDQRFTKYQWVEVTVTKSSDTRPESYVPKHKSFRILSDPLPTTNAWRARKEIVSQLEAHCLCCLEAAREQNGSPTLGLFRPKMIEEFLIKQSLEPNWTPAQLAILRQQHMFEEAPKEELEKIPFYFYYRFKCDHATCEGHRLSCTDWEMGESYRKWKRQYRDGWEQKFRQKYETEMTQKNDLHFFVGTHQQYPGVWMIVGLFYPPLASQTEMFAD